MRLHGMADRIAFMISLPNLVMQSNDAWIQDSWRTLSRPLLDRIHTRKYIYYIVNFNGIDSKSSWFQKTFKFIIDISDSACACGCVVSARRHFLCAPVGKLKITLAVLSTIADDFALGNSRLYTDIFHFDGSLAPVDVQWASMALKIIPLLLLL